ncbi:inactive receptor kinase [Musa troglodytarum]|uniref:Inactive receptor kinase n=1 Tax=Musa troglodytarum TaxID=320322 RepID=A0A9E7L5H0_9LILI|nr:inactive receptor kinase [Musa troglodytarum]URE44947.1 inactive receptor kinase [Musa troglodytarum]
MEIFREEIRNGRRKRKGVSTRVPVFPISAVEDPIKPRVPVLFFLLPQSKAPPKHLLSAYLSVGEEESKCE